MKDAECHCWTLWSDPKAKGVSIDPPSLLGLWLWMGNSRCVAAEAPVEASEGHLHRAGRPSLPARPRGQSTPPLLYALPVLAAYFFHP